MTLLIDCAAPASSINHHTRDGVPARTCASVRRFPALSPPQEAFPPFDYAASAAAPKPPALTHSHHTPAEKQDGLSNMPETAGEAR